MNTIHIYDEGQVLALGFCSLITFDMCKGFCRQEQAGSAYAAFEGYLLARRCEGVRGQAITGRAKVVCVPQECTGGGEA
jgi:hypothetical protein